MCFLFGLVEVRKMAQLEFCVELHFSWYARFSCWILCILAFWHSFFWDRDNVISALYEFVYTFWMNFRSKSTFRKLVTSKQPTLLHSMDFFFQQWRIKQQMQSFLKSAKWNVKWKEIKEIVRIKFFTYKHNKRKPLSIANHCSTNHMDFWFSANFASGLTSMGVVLNRASALVSVHCFFVFFFFGEKRFEQIWLSSSIGNTFNFLPLCILGLFVIRRFRFCILGGFCGDTKNTWQNTILTFVLRPLFRQGHIFFLRSAFRLI